MDREASKATEPVGPGLDFDKIVLMINPNSTRSEVIKQDIEELESSHYRDGDRILKFNTSPSHHVNQEKLHANLEAGDLLIVAGGDWIVREAAGIIMEDLSKFQDVKLLILPGGNANDLSYGVHGSSQLPTPSQILDRGYVKPIRPIDIDTALGVKKSHDIAIGYVGLGMTALAAETLNSWPYRSLPYYANPLIRTVYESIVAGKSILKSRPFQIEHNGQIEDLTELLFANGPRVAKHFRLPNRLEEDQIFVAKIEAEHRIKKLGSWAANIVLLGQPQIEGIFLHNESYSLTVCGPVSMQLDGEPQELHPDTQVTIKQSDNYLDFVTYSPKVFPEAVSPTSS